MNGTVNMAPPHSVGTNTNTENINTRHAMSKNPPTRRRTRSKGTIAGFKSPDGPEAPQVSADTSSASLDSSNHAQHLSLESPVPPKAAHTAKLALLCVQNAVHMGARTQLDLCPPGKARDDTMKALLERRRRKRQSIPAAPALRRNLSFSRGPSLVSVGSRIEETSAFEKLMGEAGLAEYDKAELEYLNNPSLRSLDLNSDGEEMQEDPSSGDEDLLDFNFSDEDDKDDGQSVREPLYTLGPDGSANNNQGSASSGKLAFNFRKLKWFDAVTASDRAKAREYLKKEMAGLKKRDASMLAKHLIKLQRREKRRLEIEKGRRNGTHSTLSDKLFGETEDDEDMSVGIVKFPDNMTPSLSAALVHESLAFNPLESLEGMAKCYEGIVAAGRALLDSKIDESKGSKPTKDEIISALTPLLITTLEEASGETILALARLREMCGTKRYQRRFIQRIAPSLVRPPHAAVWCLRHQNDMEAIFAATELILDSSAKIFAADWFERGRTLLADSKRAESLKVAAMQLQRLSDPRPNDSLISSLTTGTGHRRGGSLSINTPTKDSSSSGSNVNTDVLAEWEILAVDRQIRDSIQNIFSRDWSRIKIRNAPPREGESHPSKRIRGISAGKAKAAPPDIDPNPEVRDSSLMSPPRLTNSKHLLPNAPITAQPTPQSPSRTRKSPRRSKSNDTSSSRGSNGAPSLSEEQPSPPHTPKSQIEMIGSPARPSPPPPIETSSPDLKKNTSPREGIPAAPPMSPGPAPLSPSKKPFRRNESTRMSNNSPGSSSNAQSNYLRTLTSTAAERKRTVAACRALRAQITRFENTFIKVHGRAPKGQYERAPLATTYAQYREWKRAIRSDAASRIQAMFRGARVRSILIKDPRFKRIVEKRAGRVVPKINNPPQMPSAMGRDPRQIQSIAPMPLQRRDDPSSIVYDGVEVVMVPENQAAPSWSNRRISDGKSLDYSTAGTGSISSVPYSPRGDISVSSNMSIDLNQLSLPELQSQKRELKQLLKNYDMDFHRKHGRMPVKQEKEPIRNLYERYNHLKARITAVEADPSLLTKRQQWKQQLQSPSNVSQGPFSDYSTNGSISEATPSHSPSNAPRVPNRSSRRQPEPTPVSRGQDLTALKTEKQHLHQMLRAYEKDFFRINNRQVSSYQDIRPVASQYRRYKDIKKSILGLQQASQAQR